MGSKYKEYEKQYEGSCGLFSAARGDYESLVHEYLADSTFSLDDHSNNNGGSSAVIRNPEGVEVASVDLIVREGGSNLKLRVNSGLLPHRGLQLLHRGLSEIFD